MTLRSDLEALIQGALDDTLTPEGRERLARLMTESCEVAGRAAHLKEHSDLLDSLGPVAPRAAAMAWASGGSGVSSSSSSSSNTRSADTMVS